MPGKLVDDIRAKGERAVTGCFLDVRALTSGETPDVGAGPFRPARRGPKPRPHSDKNMEPILTKYVREPNSFTLDFFLKHEGYEGLKKALAMQPTTSSSR